MNRTREAVLVVTQVDDPTADLVIGELNERGVPVVRLDPGDFPEKVTLAARVNDVSGWTGELTTLTRRVDLASVRSVYWRRPSPYDFSGLNKQDAQFARAEARHGLDGVLTSLPDCRYVNHPHRNHAAEYKPTQLAVAVELGLRVPSTLITSDPAAARAFVEETGRVVYKPLRLTSYRDNGQAQAIWVADVHVTDVNERIAGTAHLFQAKVDKCADVRVTVVGDRVFAVRIDSADGLLDWRTDYGQLTYSPIAPPSGMADRLHAYLDRFGLTFGCFDFALDRRGAWHWLECNPNGQWAWLCEPTGLPMVGAFADLLIGGAQEC